VITRLSEKLKEKWMDDVPVAMGGIPKKDIPLLKQRGIAEVCPFSTPLPKVVETVSKLAATPKKA
jgi:methylmalonyl-CoA mutase cobalamin-binding domain/chain